MRKLNTSTRHHHSFVSNIEPDKHLIFTPANTTRISHEFRICQKSTVKAQTEAWRLLVLPFTRKGWIKNVEMRQETVQSHCNNVRRQRFHNKRALRRTRYEAFGATEGFGKDERESCEFQWAAKKIVQDTTATITRECAVALPKYKSLARSIQRQRGWGINPTTLKDVAIPSELQLTLQGEKFLAYDSGSDDRKRLLIFSTEQNLDLVKSTAQWHADGTFKCCPALFYQLYTVHGVLNGHTIPLVYMLLKRKTRKLYLRALNELKEINPCLQLSRITIDFEIACLLAFEELSSKVSIKSN